MSETYTKMNNIAVQHALSIIVQIRRVGKNEPVLVYRNSTANEITMNEGMKI